MVKHEPAPQDEVEREIPYWRRLLTLKERASRAFDAFAMLIVGVGMTFFIVETMVNTARGNLGPFLIPFVCFIPVVLFTVLLAINGLLSIITRSWHDP